METISAAMETMMHKSLTDLVRGIRSNKKNESKYIARAISEIKEELKSTNYNLKAIAVQKLTYLQMLGYDMGWAAFNTVEVMSQPKFTAKRIGYLAASQSFHEGTDVVILTEALFKKDMGAQNQYEAGLALNCLANICTPDIARDLAADVVALLTSSRVYIRKKAVLALYRIFLKYPDALRPAFPRLKEKLEDMDNSVVSAAVNVICELARKNPKNYLALAPVLFKILTTSSNNWMLIKIIKLFGALTPLEKRLGKKLIEPLTNLINSTTAMSLLYECIQTCTIGLASHTNIIRLCISKLRVFVEDPDQNLKYLGLLALHNIMKVHPKAVTEHRDLIIWCLDDEDVTIRLRALDLLVGMVTKKNLMDLIKKLMEKLDKADGTYREELVEKIILICSQGTYQFITDFEWYITVLIELTHVPTSKHGKLISSQLMDVIVRVKVVRPFGVRNMETMLKDSRLLSENLNKNSLAEVLYAAAWICGEFNQYLENHKEAIESLLQPRATALPEHIQSVFLQNVLKVFTYMVSSAAGIEPAIDEEADEGIEFPKYGDQEVLEAADLIKTRLEDFTQSNFTEVQERACFTLELVKELTSQEQGFVNFAVDLNELFSEVLNPVAKSAGKKAAQVGLPAGLDLDAVINEPPESDSDEEDLEKIDWGSSFEEKPSYPTKSDPHDEQRQREARLRMQQNIPFYLVDKEKKPVLAEFPPVAPAPVDIKPGRSALYPQRSSKRRTPKAKVMKLEDAPEGAESDGSDEDVAKKEFDPLANIDLSAPIKPTEVLHSVKPYAAPVIPGSIAASAAQQQQFQSQQKKTYDTRGGDKERHRDRHGRDKKDRHGRDRDRRDRSDRKDRRDKEKGKESSRRSDKSKDSGRGEDILGLSPAKGSSSSDKRRPPVSSGSLINLEDLSAPPAPSPTKAIVPISSSPAKPSHHHDAREPSKEKEKRSSRSSREEHRRDKDKDHRSSRDKKDDRSDKRRESSSSSSSSTSSSHRLAEDRNLSASYKLRAEKNKVVVAIHIRNRASSSLSRVSFAISDVPTLRLSPDNDLSPSFVVSSGKSVTHQLGFQCSSLQKGHKLTGTLSYSIGHSKSEVPLQLNVPVSTFVQPTKISREQFVSIVQSGPQLALSSNSFAVPGGLRAALPVLTDVLHLDVIETVQAAASLYGQSVLGHHVAVLAKQLPNDSLSVSIKCSDAALGNALLAEFGEHLSGSSSSGGRRSSSSATNELLL